MSAITFDPIWNKIYGDGHQQRYPWDCVVSFVFRNAPKDRARSEIRILEVGCGTASNLWFAAREGFSVAGIDASRRAIERAKARFDEEGLCGDLRVADFTHLPFADSIFDLVVDRKALSCCGHSGTARAIGEIRRVSRTGARFFFNPYARGHTSETGGEPGPDGVVTQIKRGSLTGVGQISFYDEAELQQVLHDGWNILSRQLMTREEQLAPTLGRHAEWQVVAEKSPDGTDSTSPC